MPVPSQHGWHLDNGITAKTAWNLCGKLEIKTLPGANCSLERVKNNCKRNEEHG